jgi:hypothetical protein
MQLKTHLEPLRSRLGALLLSLVFSALIPAAAAAGSTVIFLDDFDNESIGSLPSSPDIGTYSIYPSAGTHTVVNPDGNGDLRLRCDDPSASTGCSFNFAPTVSPTQRTVSEYLFRIESGAIASGFANDFVQQLVLLPLGNNVLVEWAAQGNLAGVRIHSGGQQQEQAFFSGFVWAADTDYFVEIETDPVANTYEIFIDGEPMASGTITTNFSGLDRLIAKSGSSTKGATQIDDIVITEVPEPSAAASMVAALGTLVALRRRRA